MRFQTRDSQILLAVHEYGGVLAQRHIQHKFWADKSVRAVQNRLAKLHEHEYLQRPTRQQRQTQPIPADTRSVYWLDWKGMLWVARHYGLKVEQPKTNSDYQKRKLAKALREGGLHWLREPRWTQLAHDLAVVDVRLAVEQAVSDKRGLALEGWVVESAFRAELDVVEYALEDKDGQVQKDKRGVCPDGFFVIADNARQAQGQEFRARLLLELDMATHSNPYFGRAKVAPYAAYITSEPYRKRFGANTGRWLVVATGQRRLENLKRQTERRIGAAAGLFYFTTFQLTQSRNILADPIWWPAGQEEPVALFSGRRPLR